MKIIKGQTPREIVLHEDEYPANLEPTDVVEIFQTPLTGAVLKILSTVYLLLVQQESFLLTQQHYQILVMM